MKFLATLLAAGAVLCAGAYEYPAKRMNAYPAASRPFWKNGVFKCDNPVGNSSVYGFLNLPPMTSRIQVKLTYRSVESTMASCGMNYQKPGKTRNGSAGRSPSVQLPVHGEMKTAEIAFDVPPNSATAQLVIGLKGKPTEFELRSIVWDAVSDRAALSPQSVAGKPSSWKKVTDLQNFYLAAGGGSATVQTRVRIAYDNANLYVGFIADEPNMGNIKENVTKRDGSVWNDDTVELFLFDRNRNSGWQFIVNPKNTQFDGILKQAQEGDPYKTFAWDGKWTSKIWKNKNSWEALFIIPWSTLNYAKVPEELYMNFARERTGNNEISHWNAYTGGFHTAPKYARAVFGKKGEIIRYRKAETESYLPKRAKTYGNELLSKEPGKYVVGMWAHGCYAGGYPADMRKSFTVEKQKAFQENIAKHNMFCAELPWAANPRNIPGGVKELKRLNKEFGMQFPYAVFSSAVHARASGKYHAPLHSGKWVDTASDEYLKAALDTIAGLKKFVSAPGQRELVNFVHGIDEPTNQLPSIYNIKTHPELKEPLAQYDAKVKAETGFGKYGYYDWSSTPDADTPFRKIAFYRYWDKRFANYLKVTTAAIKAIDPKLLYWAVNSNTCSGVPAMDYALASPYSACFSCDPYPTSAKNFFSMARAIYHTGFSVRMVHDLANKSRTGVMPQAFIYHGGRPKPADMREWASQALKNGAELFFWYAAGPACVTMPDGFEEMLKINKQISTMNRLELPKEMKSAILFSTADRVALDDNAAHAAYSVYSLLGEHVNANFRFVSPTGLNMGIHTLDGIRILYVPRMRYTDKESVKLILNFVKKGGTLVVFDPEFWSYHFDGSTVPERAQIMGKLTLRSGVSAPLKYGKKDLPVSAAANINLYSGKITAYDFANAAGKTVAVYPDGKPAAVKKSLGKGKVLVFGVQPFGNSDAALTPEGWKDFFTALCKQHGEKTGLPIWSYVLPNK